MENTTIIALSRQGVLRRQMDIVAQNIANMNTTAFKAHKMMNIQHEVRSRGGERIFGDKISFVRDVATVRDTREGSFTKTGNPLDVAIHGDGYFVVDTAAGERYTRNGHFRLDDTGQVVTEQGDPMLSEGGQPFFLSPEDTEITISRDGIFSTENGELGRLKVVRFENDQELLPVSGGLYSSPVPPEDVERPDMVQGMLESSNVEAVLELTRMIEIHRSYAGVTELIQKEDDRIRRMVRELTA